MDKGKLLKIAVAFLIMILCIGIVYLMRTNNPNSKEEQYPPPSWTPTFNITLNVGDSWKLALIIDEKDYTLNVTVTSEEKVDNTDCYVMALTFEPENPRAETGIFNEMISWLDKKTLNLVQLKGEGRAEGHDFIYTEKHSYTFQGGGENPIAVGTEYNQTDIKTTNVDVHIGLGAWNKGYIHQKSTTKDFIRVEDIENITVPAGVFNCYRIVTYDEIGQSPISAKWFSVDAKNVIRNENYLMSERSELLSYYIQGMHEI